MSKRNELRDDIYQRMHGFKTVKRGYRKDGQSKWYYIDPRGAHSVEDMKEIDVPSENAPNPKLNDILADDMQKNPQDYYIWRTVGDDKVRGKHAEREGKIFNKNVPPEGGNPGEDYNCRCWAEPYKPERYADKPMIIDVSGILPENANKDKKIPEGSYITEQGNMTTDTPVQFLKLPETEKSDNQVHNVPLIPIPSPKPKVTEFQTTTQKIVPVPTRKPLPANATLEQMLQRYILEHSPNLQQNLPQLNSTNSYKTESSLGYPNNTQSPYYQQMGKPYSSQPISKYRLGSLSSSMESHGDPSIIGTDNAGGPSYGLYQIATNPGTMKLYIKYLQKSPQYEIYADLLNQAGGNEGAKNKSKQFVDMWKKLSKDDSFNDSQFNFIVDTHLSPLIDKAKLPELLDIEHRHPVVKDALYSISVQHAGALKILNDTLIELYQHYGDNVDDETLLKTLYKNRTEYVRALKESERPGDNRITKREKENIIYKRYPEELQKALRYLK